MKFTRFYYFLLVFIILNACVFLPGNNEISDKGTQTTTENNQGTKTASEAFAKKFKCPENAHKILFSSEVNPLGVTNFDIYIANDDASMITHLTEGAAWEGGPAWSPDRCRIAYVATSDQKSLEDIYLMDADGGSRTRLTSSAGNDREPDWSPDGKKIVFMSDRDKNREIYVMTFKGTNQERLTETPSNDENPHWSPDNDKIAFSTHRDGNWEIYTMNIDGTNLINLTKNADQDMDPTWSPDGSEIAFYSNRSDYNEIYIMDKNGGNLRQITHQNGGDPSIDLDISWSPDSQWIAFVGTTTGKDGGGMQAVFKASVDGSSILPLMNRDPSRSNEIGW